MDVKLKYFTQVLQKICKACFDTIGVYWQLRLQRHFSKPNSTTGTDYIANKERVVHSQNFLKKKLGNQDIVRV